MEWILSLFLTGYGQRSRTSFNICKKKKFWILTNRCGNNLKHENEAEQWLFSLVFVFKIISTFIGQISKFFLCMCCRRMCSASLTIAREKQT